MLPKFSPQKVEYLQSASSKNSLKLQNPGYFEILLISVQGRGRVAGRGGAGQGWGWGDGVFIKAEPFPKALI